MRLPRETRTYVAIDLKSFFASVECVLRGLDPLSTNLVGFLGVHVCLKLSRRCVKSNAGRARM